MCIDRRRGQAGLTLIELIVFIVVVSLGLAGVLSVLNITVLKSADPLVSKQALAVADALLEEIMLKDYCDPTPAISVSGNLSAGSAVLSGIMPGTTGIAANWRVSGSGTPAGATVASVDSATQITLSTSATEARTNAALRFMPCTAAVEAARADYDDVRDYHNTAYANATDATGVALFSPANLYQTKVSVTQPTLAGGAGTGISAGDVFMIIVTVRAPDGSEYVATGYRYNHD